MTTLNTVLIDSFSVCVDDAQTVPTVEHATGIIIAMQNILVHADEYNAIGKEALVECHRLLELAKTRRDVLREAIEAGETNE